MLKTETTDYEQPVIHRIELIKIYFEEKLQQLPLWMSNYRSDRIILKNIRLEKLYFPEA